jgi:hypothetical protein
MMSCLVVLSVAAGLAGADESGGAAQAWVARLIAESKNKAAVDVSDAYYEERHVRPADLPLVLDYIRKHPDYTSYHLLFVLRRDQPTAYHKLPATVRASVLFSALKELTSFNDWEEPCEGLDIRYEPNSDSPDQMLLEIGRPALPYLLPLLDNRSEASYGDEEDEAEYDNYRRADVAFRFVSSILGLPYDFRPDPAERDQAIAAFKKELMPDRQSKGRK